MFLFGNAGGTKFASCFICNEHGHLSKNCPKNSHGIYPKVYLLLVFDVGLFCNSESCIVGIILLEHKCSPIPVFEPCWCLLNLHFSQLLSEILTSFIWFLYRAVVVKYVVGLHIWPKIVLTKAATTVQLLQFLEVTHASFYELTFLISSIPI